MRLFILVALLITTELCAQDKVFLNIAHMRNTPTGVKEALEDNANAIECDIKVVQEKNGKYHFEVHHGCVPLGISGPNSCKKSNLSSFLSAIKQLKKKHPEFSAIFFDCKLNSKIKRKRKIKRKKKKNDSILASIGEDFIRIIRDSFYSDDSSIELVSVITIACPEHAIYFSKMEKIFSQVKIPIALGIDSYKKIEKVKEVLHLHAPFCENYWYANGTTRFVPFSIGQPYIPFLEDAMNDGEFSMTYHWTINKRKEMIKFLDLGVNGIMTNKPARLNELFLKLNKEEIRLANFQDLMKIHLTWN